jgi:hypothetical protein
VAAHQCGSTFRRIVLVWPISTFKRRPPSMWKKSMTKAGIVVPLAASIEAAIHCARCKIAFPSTWPPQARCYASGHRLIHCAALILSLMPSSSFTGRRIGLVQSEDCAATAIASKRSKNAIRSERVQDFLRALDFEAVHSAGVRSTNVGEVLSNDAAQCHFRQSEHPPDDRQMAGTPPACKIVEADTRLVTQSTRGLLLQLAGPVADRHRSLQSENFASSKPKTEMRNRSFERSSKSNIARQRATSY